MAEPIHSAEQRAALRMMGDAIYNALATGLSTKTVLDNAIHLTFHSRPPPELRPRSSREARNLAPPLIQTLGFPISNAFASIEAPELRRRALRLDKWLTEEEFATSSGAGGEVKHLTKEQINYVKETFVRDAMGPPGKTVLCSRVRYYSGSRSLANPSLSGRARQLIDNPKCSDQLKSLVTEMSNTEHLSINNKMVRTFERNLSQRRMYRAYEDFVEDATDANSRSRKFLSLNGYDLGLKGRGVRSLCINYLKNALGFENPKKCSRHITQGKIMYILYECLGKGILALLSDQAMSRFERLPRPALSKIFSHIADKFPELVAISDQLAILVVNPIEEGQALSLPDLKNSQSLTIQEILDQLNGQDWIMEDDASDNNDEEACEQM